MNYKVAGFKKCGRTIIVPGAKTTSDFLLGYREKFPG